MAAILKLNQPNCMKKSPNYNSQYFSLFLFERHGFSAKSITIPEKLSTEFLTIKQVLAKKLEVFE